MRYMYAILKIHKEFIKSGKDLLTAINIYESLQS